jgi:phospholipid N-methyltransferase
MRMMKSKIAENVFFNFLNEYVRNFREIGSIGPDSAVCVNSLLKSIPFESAEKILEYGAGSGAVTMEILRRKKPKSTLICFEKNNTFYHLLRKTVTGQNVFVVHDDVFNSTNILLSRFGIPSGSLDCIISTLPCSSLKFDELLQKEVLPLLKADGRFIQYMHTVSTLKGFRLQPILRKYFSRIDSDFVFFNLPPALIYTCRGHVKTQA